MKIMVKTRTSATTRVAIAAVAVVMLGLAAYGLGYGYAPKIKTYGIFGSERGMISSGSQPATPPSEAPKTGQPKNKPVLTLKGEKGGFGPLYSSEDSDQTLYYFKLDSTKDPKIYGAIQLRQLVFAVRASKGLELHSFSLKVGNKYLNAAIRALRQSDPTVVFDVGNSPHPILQQTQQSIDAISSYPATGDMDEFYVIVDASTFVVSQSGGVELELVARVSGVKKIKKPKIETSLFGKTIEPSTSGYLWIKRDYVLDSAKSDKITKAASEILYVMRNEPPVDTSPTNMHPDYLSWCPTIWTDGSAINHSHQMGYDGGTRDWFCLSESLGTYTRK